MALLPSVIKTFLQSVDQIESIFHILNCVFMLYFFSLWVNIIIPNTL